MSLIAPTVQAYFTERLVTQRNLSPRTIASYSTFRLLLSFASQRTGKQPCQLDIDDLDAPLIGAFLTHLERDRANSIRTRNNRLAAIHSFCKYSALRHPEHLATLGRVLAIPTKRYQQNTVGYLQLEEIKALLAAPDRSTWLGRRDHALMLTMILTGVRVTELVTLTVGDVSLSTGAHIKIQGKGRKRRTTTLTPETVAVLRQWLRECQGQPHDPLFPTRQGGQLSRHTVALLISKHATTAADRSPSINSKRITPHTLRQSNAMAPPSRRDRPRDHRPAARPRTRPDHPHLRTRRPSAQRTSSRQTRATRDQTPQIPAIRHAARVPRQPLIMLSDTPP